MSPVTHRAFEEPSPRRHGFSFVTATTAGVGSVHGLSVWPADRHGWHWPAFGPRGRRTGQANTQPEARRAAEAATKELR